MALRKIVKILSRSERSKFDNYDYKVLLECGHETGATFHHGERVVGRRKLCYQCKGTTKITPLKCDWVPDSPSYRVYKPWSGWCQRCGDCKPKPISEPEKYHVHGVAWRATGKRNKFNQPTYEITCPNCERVWISVLRSMTTCRHQDGGCDYKFKR